MRFERGEIENIQFSLFIAIIKT